MFRFTQLVLLISFISVFSLQKSDEFIDYYELLNVKPTASTDEIKVQVKKMLMLFHPDKSAFRNASTVTELIYQARIMLLDESRRPWYNVQHTEFYAKDQNRKLLDSEFLITSFSFDKETFINMVLRLESNDRHAGWAIFVYYDETCLKSRLFSRAWQTYSLILQRSAAILTGNIRIKGNQQLRQLLMIELKDLPMIVFFRNSTEIDRIALAKHDQLAKDYLIDRTIDIFFNGSLTVLESWNSRDAWRVSHSQYLSNLQVILVRIDSRKETGLTQYSTAYLLQHQGFDFACISESLIPKSISSCVVISFRGTYIQLHRACGWKAREKLTYFSESFFPLLENEAAARQCRLELGNSISIYIFYVTTEDSWIDHRENALLLWEYVQDDPKLTLGRIECKCDANIIDLSCCLALEHVVFIFRGKNNEYLMSMIANSSFEELLGVLDCILGGSLNEIPVSPYNESIFNQSQLSSKWKLKDLYFSSNTWWNFVLQSLNSVTLLLITFIYFIYDLI